MAYLGVTKSTLISVTDIFRLVHFDFPQFKYSLAWYLIAGFTVVTTLLFGRLSCGRICAFGALTQLLDAVVPKRLRWEPSATVERYAGYVKYALLFGVVGYYAATDHFTIYRYVEPFWMCTRQGTVVLWTMLGMLLLATLVVRNLYCRFLCPVGAALRADLAGDDSLPDQAVVGVQDVQDLRAHVRVGRHPRTADRPLRVRPLRRLRACLRRREEVRALDRRAPQGEEPSGRRQGRGVVSAA
ncbi:MAG: 4Fe-4S binding protein [Vicinamibacterales bacterium]